MEVSESYEYLQMASILKIKSPTETKELMLPPTKMYLYLLL